MRLGINATAGAPKVSDVIDVARRAEADGFDSFWIAQIFDLDALTTLAVVGSEVPRIELGTAVVPTFPRHPMMLAGQALTVQQVVDDRLCLGIGLSHQIVVENMWGYSYERPATQMREYLEALQPLLQGESVAVDGEYVTCHGALGVIAPTPEVVIAALGDRMLRLAGSRGCGTVTWCTGEATLRDHIVPTITAAAAEAGHPPPRVVASLPITVTDDPVRARSIVGEMLALYGGLPSYRAMLDREGVEGPADVAIAGSEEEVTDALVRLADAGVTDFAAVVVGADASERERTWELLASHTGG